MAALMAGMIAVFLYLLYRNLGLNPVVMADEWAYSLYSRHLPFSAAPMPSYLYFWIFKQTSHCGDSFLECARVFNGILFVAAAPFIYRVARLVTTPAIAVFVALLSIAAPVNLYTALYMPEAMYFGGFWVLSWFALCKRGWKPISYGAVLGAMVACMAMIKLHGIFLIPGLALLILFESIRCNRRAWLKTFALTLVALLVSTFVTRLLLGFLFAGKAGLHIVGSKYGDVADSSLNLAALLHVTSLALFVLRGHLVALALLFGVPLACLLVWRRQDRPDSVTSDNLAAIKAYALAIIFSLVLIGSYYTATVAGPPGYEPITRQHTRYYDFALPLLFIAAAAEMTSEKGRTRLRLTIPVAILIAVGAIYSCWALLSVYGPNMVDGPEILGAISHHGLLYTLGGTSAALLLLWAMKPRLGSRLFVFIFMPLSVLGTAHWVDHDLRRYLEPQNYDNAGIVAHHALDRAQRPDLVIVGTDVTQLFKALFRVDDPKTQIMMIPEGAPFDPSRVPPSDRWVLLIGRHPVPPGYKVLLTGQGFVFLGTQASTMTTEETGLK